MSKVLKTFDYKGHKLDLRENRLLFHGTTSENLKSIYELGITPEKSVWHSKSVWLDTVISSAYNFANNSEGKGSPKVLVVYPENLDLDKLELDDYNFDFFDEIIEEDGTITFDQITLKYSGVIPSEGLDIIIEEDVDTLYIQELKEYLEELGEI